MGEGLTVSPVPFFLRATQTCSPCVPLFLPFQFLQKLVQTTL